ncbi:hypothetical protein H4217_002983 [Coemansia sp. RSA 1939]|nr:hypothetical protein H4217_002983 [Coemansia sp. RSA 1939]KAJ2613591.1 hypothetical protein EV177_002468 [Coemansia sp. RSA 1804]
MEESNHNDSNPQKITLHVRQTNGTVINHSVSSVDVLVADLKLSLAELTEIPVERIRLMAKSTILADDKTLGFYGVEDGAVLRLVQLAGSNLTGAQPRSLAGISKANAPSPSSSQTNALSSQARQLFLSNPRLAQTMMMANPHMRRAIEENPELRQIMSDPSIMRQSLDAAQNPQLMQEVQRNNDRALSNLEAAPGGYAHIRRMYHSIQEPLNQAARDSSRTPLDDLNRRRAQALGASRPDPGRVNTTPLPNPWARRRHASSSSSTAGSQRRAMAANAATDQVSRSADRLARLDISAPRTTSAASAAAAAAASASAAADEMRDPLGIVQAAGGSGDGRMRSLPSFLEAMQQGSAMLRPPGSSSASMGAGSGDAPAMGRLSREPPASAPAQSAAAAAGLSSEDLDRFRHQFQSELDQLEEMGFIDKPKNLKALIASNGDLNLAINIITGEED